MREVDDLLRSMGASHLVWESSSRRADSLAGDLVFFSYALRHGKGRIAMGSYWLAAMPDSPPPDAPHGSVVVVGCAPGPYASGVYELGDLAIPPVPGDSPSRYPRPRRSWDALGASERAASLADAEFVVAEPACHEIPEHGLDGLIPLARRGPYTLYAR
jgi:hypothetical protein